MTATDVLRRLLDERGAWWDYGIRGASTTRFNVNGVDLTFTPMRDGLVCSTILTPEQAIAATLGSCNCTNGERTETCDVDETDTWECVRDDLGGYGKRLTVHVMECTECGHTYEHVNGDYEFCPRCGRKRKDVDA